MTDTRPTRRRLLAGIAGATVAGLAGCTGGSGAGGTDSGGGQTSESDDHAGHGDEAHGHDTVSEPTATREVAVNTVQSGDTTQYHFDPHVTWVEPGGTVTWTLESGTHTATAYHPGNDEPRLVPEGTEAWDSGTMSEDGETFEHTFETEGVYHYLCAPHEQFGMLATVIVGEPHLDDQRALQTMPEEKSEEVHGKLDELNSMVRSIVGEGHHDTATEGDHHGTESDGDHHDTETEGDHHGTESDGGHHGDDTQTEDGHDH